MRQEQRQQIAETILNTQEEERRRIAEDLHNCLGQLLYGIKLNLSQIDVKSPGSRPGNKSAMQYTEKLLDDSIRECRRISHELTPAILEDFGLHEAVKAICRQLTNGTRFDYSIRGWAQRLDRFLEIAVYRIIQELMLNVVKHAEATRTVINLEFEEAAIQIRVADNGKGFDESLIETNGIGLQMIRNKVALLSGTLNITSAKGKGTTVGINIPKRVD